MSTVQSAYKVRAAGVLRAGMIPDGTPRKVRTYRAESDLDFGVAVHQGTAADQVEAGTTGAAAGVTHFIGITVRDRTRAPGSDGYKEGDNVSVLYEGVIAVEVEAAVTVGANVSSKDADGQLSTAAGSATHSPIPRARFLTAAAADGIAIVEIGTDQVGGA